MPLHVFEYVPVKDELLKYTEGYDIENGFISCSHKKKYEYKISTCILHVKIMYVLCYIYRTEKTYIYHAP